MRLLRFKADALHGYLKFNLKFQKQLNFLTGINGSGKTTALNSIVALITPDLMMLADLRFGNITVDVENEGKNISISAMSRNEGIALSCSGIPEPFIFPRYAPDPESTTYRQNESAAEFYRDLLASQATHPVLSAIASLPTPMFLGIDRRATFDDDTTRRQRFAAPRPRLGRNIFSRSLATSLAAASYLAEEAYKDALIVSGRIAERLQREMLLSLLTAEPGEAAGHGPLKLPNSNDLREIEKVRRDLDSISVLFRLPVQDVKRRLVPLLDTLRETADRIPKGTNIDDAFRSHSDNEAVISALFSWNSSQIQLRRIKLISETVANYNDYRAKALEPTKKYLELVNTFLKDSGKSIAFGEDNTLSVRIDGLEGDRSINFLSSGEAQIFVILTHLAFNKLASKNNVFIIDEPELSLHVQWQEIFVDSVLTTNPNIQYILATHSPSIILDRVENCIDISRKTTRA